MEKRVTDELAHLEALRDKIATRYNDVSVIIRRHVAQSLSLPCIVTFDGKERLAPLVAEEAPPWKSFPFAETAIPGMLMPEEKRYYGYLCRFYSGEGELVELGPWLGCSTLCIATALKRNPRFQGRRVHVYDDFVWRKSFMDQHVAPDERLPEHEDFRFLFDRYTTDIADAIVVEKRRIFDYEGNEDIPLLRWAGGPIELLIVDCGRTFQANESWYRIFSPSFIPGRTLIAMQDWGLHREVPVKWYNQTLQFTESKGGCLQLVHELMEGCTATFLYRG